MRRLFLTKNRNVYLAAWKEFISKTNKKVVKGYLGKPYPPDFAYKVTSYNFQVTDDVVYRLRFAVEDEPLTADYPNYLGFWAKKFFDGERVYVYNPKRKEFVIVTKMPTVMDGALYQGNLIFSNKGFQPYGVEITTDFKLIEMYDERGYPIRKEVEMPDDLVCRAVVEAEEVLTDYEKRPKYVAIVYDKATGEQKGMMPVQDKKALKEQLQKMNSVTTYTVVYKVAKTYTAQLPIVEVE